MSNIIDKIQVSGVTYDIGGTGGGGNPTVELTQAEYDALVTAGTVSADTYYIITDAQAGDLTNYYTKTETNTLLGGKADTATTYTKTEVDTALGGKQATLVSGTNIKTINNQSLLGSGNIDIQGGGGKAISGGTNISVTTGETADTVSCTLPLTVGSSNSSLSLGVDNSLNNSSRTFAIGDRNSIGNLSSNSLVGGMRSSINYNCASSIAFGYEANVGGEYSCSIGSNTKTSNDYEAAFGRYNASNTGSTDADKTRFSVGNGTDDNARHNAFEIRQNGDIYLSSGGTDIKLQDHLGGSSITVDTALDSGSTNAVANSAITNAFTAVNDNINELSANSVTNCSNVEIVSSAPTPPSTIADGYVKVTWEDDYTQTYTVDYSGNIGDFDTHYKSNITKVEFGISRVEINSYNFGFANDDCYSLKTVIFNGDVNLELITFDSAYQLECVYFYAPSPSGITGVDEYFLNSVYDGCQTYETSAATYPIYVADLAAYSGAVLCYSYDLGRNITWSEHFGNRLQEIPSEKKFVYNDFVAYSAATDAALASKQTTLTAGTGISIVDNVISATGGGGGVTVVQTTGTSTTDVMSQDAVTTQLNNKANKTAAFGGYQFGSTNNTNYLQYTNVNTDNIGSSIYYPKINGKGIFTNNSTWAQNNYDFQLIETSAITTSVTSSSTDAQVPSAKAVNDKLGGLSLVKLTQSEYDALSPNYDSNTLYVIVN